MLIDSLLMITVGVILMFLYHLKFQRVKTCQLLANISKGKACIYCIKKIALYLMSLPSFMQKISKIFHCSKYYLSSLHTS